jgi:uncharacterized protein DUF1801
MTTPDQYIAKIDDEPKRAEVRRLHALIRKTLPSFEPGVFGTMLGYGKYHYRYPSGREGVSYRVALASTKTGISVYVCAVDERGWLAEQAKDRLGKASVGKSCIRFKRLADIDLAALTNVLKRARTVLPPGAIDPKAEKTATKKAATKKAATKKAATKKAATRRAS